MFYTAFYKMLHEASFSSGFKMHSPVIIRAGQPQKWEGRELSFVGELTT